MSLVCESDIRLKWNAIPTLFLPDKSKAPKQEPETRVDNEDSELKELELCKCKICGFKCVGKLHFHQHSKIHRKPFICEICDYRTTHQFELRQHIRVHIGEKPYLCTVCGSRFSSPGVLNYHMTKHKDEVQSSPPANKSYECEFRDYLSAEQKSLLKCTRIDSDVKSYKCNVCEMPFVSKCTLLAHNRREHPGEKLFSCKHCEFKTDIGTNLTEHVRTHTGEKPYECPICQYKTSRKVHIENHMRFHTGEKPYLCEICGFQTPSANTLKTHLDDHTKSHIYKCSLCPYSSVLHGRVVKHLLTHNGYKPFKCPHCPFSTAYKYNLKHHSHTHTGVEKQLVCHICGYRDHLLGNLKKHLRIHLK